MIKRLFVLCSILLTTSVTAQVNDYFVNDPGWLCYTSRYPWPCQYEDSIHYYINGDSVINSMTYKKLYKRGHSIAYSIALPAPCSWNYTYQDTMPTGFLRSQGLQMYYMPYTDSVEYLLYDFNLTVGSQLPQTYVYTDTIYTVTSIDSIYTSAGYRKRFYVNGSQTECWLEGIGSSSGLIEPFGFLFEGSAELYCYSQNDTAYWPAIGPECSIITAVAQTGQTGTAKIYPNPATSTVNIVANLSGILEITNAQGQIVHSETFNRQTEIDLTSFAPGAYTCSIIAEDKRSFALLIVQ